MLLDILSFSVIFSYIIPFVLYIKTSSIIHIKALLYLIGLVSISEYSKFNIIRSKSVRPYGASNCNMLCNDGNQSGQPGMPSSHSLVATFFSCYYLQFTTNPILKIILYIYPILIMLSRYLKRCHTIYQIGTGSFIGAISALIIVRHL
jgi:membrane-associated phospholipid phosphatase